MATDNSSSKNQKTNIIIITGDDDTYQNLLSIIQKTEKSNALDDITKHRVITESIEDKVRVSSKRRKTDLTCVVCEDQCSGYNFSVISCESCKAFFHRNMFQNVNDLKCLTNTKKCNIQFQNRRRMCRRCRLEKCLSVGMKRNSSANEEKKLNRLRQLEENRRATINGISTSTKTSSMDVSLAEDEQLMNNEPIRVLHSQKKSNIEQPATTWLCPVQRTTAARQNHFLTLDDYNRLNSVKLAYDRAFRFKAVKHDISVFSNVIDRRTALLRLASIMYDTGMQLITFIRKIPGFELLNGHDRFILVKYNCPLLFFMHQCLHFDTNRDLIVDAEVESEEYAAARKQMFRYCYGMQLSLSSNQLFRSIKMITDDDPIILQLMIIIMTFAKSTATEDVVINEESVLLSSKQVYEAQAIYTSLLFRYMIEKHCSYYQAVRQYSQLIQKVIQMQLLAQTYKTFLREQLAGIEDSEVHPIMKSILNLH